MGKHGLHRNRLFVGHRVEDAVAGGLKVGEEHDSRLGLAVLGGRSEGEGDSSLRPTFVGLADGRTCEIKDDLAGGATSVTLVLWGTIGCHAWLEAHDKDGKLLDRAALPDTVPERKSPSDPIPSFELTVKANDIAYILFGGAHNGGALVADEMRYTPRSD